jgi:PadR family transcriptional regulator, regulatory protein AphA
MNLTTTAYAILGQLAMQPWTMYELASQMRRNVHYFFPRAESQVYAEPKRLVKLGLAKANTEKTGRRARTVYSITSAGRAELARWLAGPPTKGPLLEFEGLLRVFLAPFGSTQDLEATLRAVRIDIVGLLDLSERVRLEYLDDRAPFQRYVLTRSMVHDFLFSFAKLVDEWAERCSARTAALNRQTESESRQAALDVLLHNTRAGRRKPPTATKGARSRLAGRPRKKR